MDWHSRWQDRNTPWDLAQVTPPLTHLLRESTLRSCGLPEVASVAVPGCGRGHDLRAFAGQGHRVTGFDIVPEAVDEARELLRLNRVDEGEEPGQVRVLCRDVLGLGPEHQRAFDLVYDYTCFCAMPVHLRPVYVEAMARLLRRDGLFLHLAFPMDEARAGVDGPPHLIRPEHLEQVFPKRFEPLIDFEPIQSAVPRLGAERWFLWRLRS